MEMPRRDLMVCAENPELHGEAGADKALNPVAIMQHHLVADPIGGNNDRQSISLFQLLVYRYSR